MVGGLLRGGEFLLRESVTAKLFTPEDFTSEPQQTEQEILLAAAGRDKQQRLLALAQVSALN